jgi:hypothetical protein
MEIVMPIIREKEEVMLVIGQVGSDAGYGILTPHGIVHVPGNNPEAREAFQAAMKSYAKLQAIAEREQAGQVA